MEISKSNKKYLRKLIAEQFEILDKQDEIVDAVEPDPILLPLEENFDQVEIENVLKSTEKNISELHLLNEELKRMKQLVDFRSPLLSKD